ncbi:MAG TPA: DUF503 domain-containing protein [Polyangia bacterium]|jgi:hypothetical protein
MTVGIARITLFLSASHSLKEKRMVLRRLKAHVREKFNAAIAEVGENELWQRAAVGISVVGNERVHTEASLDEIIRFVRSITDVTHVDRELQTFNDDFPVGGGFENWRG